MPRSPHGDQIASLIQTFWLVYPIPTPDQVMTLCLDILAVLDGQKPHMALEHIPLKEGGHLLILRHRTLYRRNQKGRKDG